MKRINHLIPKIACFENLQLAYYKAKKGKEQKPAVITFAKDLQSNLSKLQNQIVTGEIDVGNYHYFTIYDPKQRQICAAEFHERVLHHAIMNVCHPYFEKYQIFDSYATRIEKGTYKALARATHFQKRFDWYMKFDIRKYFDSIDHEALLKMLHKKFKDAGLLAIFNKIIYSYETSEGKGVPIGNLTSQYFANHYLAQLDHYIKDHLGVSAYVRYMDDFIVWHNNKVALIEIGGQIVLFLSKKLSLSLKTYFLNHTNRGVAFLSYYIFPEKIHLARRSKKRYQVKMKELNYLLEEELILQIDFQKKALALHAFVFHANSYYFRKKVLENIGQ